MIPNLVATAQNYLKYEKKLLTDVTTLRAKAVSGTLTEEEKVGVDSKLGKMIGGIMIAVENYPNLRANENILQLQAAINEVEEQLSAARRAYNYAVTDYNNAVEMFPGNIMMAGMIRYKRKNVFKIDETEGRNISVKELFQR